MNPTRRRFRAERRRLATLLRTETVGGAFLVIAAIAAVIAANSPLHDAYVAARDWTVGPSALGLHLTLGEWTSDGLLAVFFFLAGLELKYEFVRGELRDPRRAVVPVAAAVGGMAAPAVVYVLVNWHIRGDLVGWAIPTATDIAFALAVLAVVGRHLPPMLRTFLLTLAVVDDLLAIAVIAVFYTRDVRPLYLLLALVVWVAFTALVHVRRPRRWQLAPAVVLALVTWGLMHASGVHATVAGVLLGFAIPVLGRRRDGGDEESPREHPPTLGRQLDTSLRPFSAGLAVPLFAFFAAGVAVGGIGGLVDSVESRITLGVTGGLVLGKTIGIFLTTALVARVARSPLLRVLHPIDLLGLAVLGGVGFTVSLLIGELAFGHSEQLADEARIGVLLGSVIAALIAALILGLRSRHYRPQAEAEQRAEREHGVEREQGAEREYGAEREHDAAQQVGHAHATASSKTGADSAEQVE